MQCARACKGRGQRAMDRTCFQQRGRLVQRAPRRGRRIDEVGSSSRRSLAHAAACDEQQRRQDTAPATSCLHACRNALRPSRLHTALTWHRRQQGQREPGQPAAAHAVERATRSPTAAAHAGRAFLVATIPIACHAVSLRLLSPTSALAGGWGLAAPLSTNAAA